MPKKRPKTMVGEGAKARLTAGFPPSWASTEFRENFWFRTDPIRERTSNAGTFGTGRGPAMTAPTTNRFDAFKAEATKPHDRTRPIMLTNEIAVESLVSLLHEFVALRALPAL